MFRVELLFVFVSPEGADAYITPYKRARNDVSAVRGG